MCNDMTMIKALFDPISFLFLFYLVLVFVRIILSMVTKSDLGHAAEYRHSTWFLRKKVGSCFVLMYGVLSHPS